MDGYNPSLAFSAHRPRDKTPNNKPPPRPLPKHNFNPLPLTPSPQKTHEAAKYPAGPSFARGEGPVAARLFNSNHQGPRGKEEGAVVRSPREGYAGVPSPARGGKERKVSENNIMFESKLNRQYEKREEHPVTATKERRGSCNNLWVNNFAFKQPRLSMADQPERDLSFEKKAQPKRKWAENNTFSMEDTIEEEPVPPATQVSPPSLPTPSPLPKQRKYSDNACAKKAPSFLTTPRESKGLVLTPRAKWSIERFKILRELGKGAYGRVVLGLQRESGMVVAIKILSKRDLKEENMVEQLAREVKIQCFLSHPNIVRVYGFFDDFLHLYIVMEAALDERLSDILKDSHLDEDNAATVFYQLCSAVAHLHIQNVIHRDLKPQNVILHEGVVKVCDFGWSVHQGGQLRTTFCGTPLYLSPEILVGDSYDESVDVWALGIMLYEMVLGSGPFQITKSQDLAKILHEKIDLRQSPISAELKVLIENCLKKSSGDRPSVKWLMNQPWARRGRPDECRRFASSNDL